jgi:hypothetical protein
MKRINILVIFILCFVSTYAEEIPCEELVPTYEQRINFELPRLGYEYIKPDAIYLGAECWYLWGFNTHGVQLILGEAEGRIGYNFLLNPLNVMTPFIGGGYFRSFESSRKQEIGFASLGFRYEHIFNRIFNLGVNLEGMLGHSLNRRQISWGNPIWGVDIGIPFTWRFTRKKNWDIRLEPFFTGWLGQNRNCFFGGLRGAFGYRF